MELTSWTVIAGIFKTSKQGYIELKFSQYRDSKMKRTTPDVVNILVQTPIYHCVCDPSKIFVKWEEFRCIVSSMYVKDTLEKISKGIKKQS